MYSIFIWKVNLSISTVSAILKMNYYAGSDWFAEECNGKLVCYDLLAQKEWKSVYCIQAQSRNSLGSDLLAVQKVPYCLLSETPYGTVEQWGIWMRLKTVIPWNEIEQREKEWMSLINTL